MGRDQKTKRIAELASKEVGSTGTPTFVSVTVTDLDGSRIVLSDSGSTLATSDYLQHNETTHITKLGNVEGGNYTEIEADGTIEFLGNATVWEDRNIGSVSLGAGASAPDLIALGGGANTIFIRGFNGAATTEQLFFELEIPHSAKAVSDITFHLHWCPTTADAGNVKWQMTYVLYGDGETLPAETTKTVVSASNGVAWTMQRSDFAVIGITSINKQLCGRLFRNPSDDADTYPADAGVFTTGFHYEIDTVGSRQITTK